MLGDGTQLGQGWVLAAAGPYLVQSGGGINVVFSPTEFYEFQVSGSDYTPDEGIQESLASGPGGLLYFTATDGTVFAFMPPSDYTDARAGQFVGSYSPDGSMTVVTALDSSAFNQISQVEYFTAGSTTPYQTLNIVYGPTGGPANAVKSLTLLGSDGSTQRQVVYTYYDGTTSYGAAGCLESAAMYAADSSGTLQFTGMDYYRYTGPALSLVLSPQDVANAVGAGMSAADTLSALQALPTNDTGGTYGLADYASAAYQYTGLRKSRRRPS